MHISISQQAGTTLTLAHWLYVSEISCNPSCWRSHKIMWFQKGWSGCLETGNELPTQWCLQHVVPLGSHPFKYWPCSTSL